MVLVCGASAGVASALLTPVVMRRARQAGWVAHPDEDRWHNGRAVALMGGVAIFAAVALAVAVVGLGAGVHTLRGGAIAAAATLELPRFGGRIFT